MTLMRCHTLNLATLLLTKLDVSPHHCILLTETLLLPREYLKETPMPNANVSSYTDGSYLEHENGKFFY